MLKEKIKLDSEEAEKSIEYKTQYLTDYQLINELLVILQFYPNNKSMPQLLFERVIELINEQEMRKNYEQQRGY